MTDILYKELMYLATYFMILSYYYQGLNYALKGMEGADLDGFSRFMEGESKERYLFFKEICKFLSCNDRFVILEQIPKPEQSMSHPKDALEKAMIKEDDALTKIHNMIGLAKEHKDYEVESFLGELYAYCSKERREVKKLLDSVIMLNDNRAGLYTINAKLFEEYGPEPESKMSIYNC